MVDELFVGSNRTYSRRLADVCLPLDNVIPRRLLFVTSLRRLGWPHAIPARLRRDQIRAGDDVAMMTSSQRMMRNSASIHPTPRAWSCWESLDLLVTDSQSKDDKFKIAAGI
jgi:hypothetical protein